jgi:hypothetical protein
MIINKDLKIFIELIYTENLNFKSISECDLRKQLKNNAYYNIRLFCLENKIITIKFHEINLTLFGMEFFKAINKLEKF